MLETPKLLLAMLKEADVISFQAGKYKLQKEPPSREGVVSSTWEIPEHMNKP